MEEKVKGSKQTGVFFGFSQAGRTIFLGLAFSLGFVIAINWFGVPVEEVFKGSFIPFFAFLGAGSAAAMIPNIEAAKAKAQPIFDFIDEKSTLDSRLVTKDKIS